VTSSAIHSNRRDIARRGFITTLEKQQTGNSHHEDHEDLRAILPTSPTTAGRGKPLQAITRRQFTTFFKQTVVGDHYSCLQNVVREQFLGQRAGRRQRGKNRYRGGEHRRYQRGGRGGGKIHFQEYRNKKRILRRDNKATSNRKRKKTRSRNHERKYRTQQWRRSAT
jgi:hypothetical protein